MSVRRRRAKEVVGAKWWGTGGQLRSAALVANLKKSSRRLKNQLNYPPPLAARRQAAEAWRGWWGGRRPSCTCRGATRRRRRADVRRAYDERLPSQSSAAARVLRSHTRSLARTRSFSAGSVRVHGWRARRARHGAVLPRDAFTLLRHPSWRPAVRAHPHTRQRQRESEERARRAHHTVQCRDVATTVLGRLHDAPATTPLAGECYARASSSVDLGLQLRRTCSSLRARARVGL